MKKQVAVFAAGLVLGAGFMWIPAMRYSFGSVSVSGFVYHVKRDRLTGEMWQASITRAKWQKINHEPEIFDPFAAGLAVPAD